MNLTGLIETVEDGGKKYLKLNVWHIFVMALLIGTFANLPFFVEMLGMSYDVRTTREKYIEDKLTSLQNNISRLTDIASKQAQTDKEFDAMMRNIEKRLYLLENQYKD